MILTLVNLFLVLSVYFYLSKLKKIGCKCAFTSHYYFITIYIILSLLLIFLWTIIDINTYPNIFVFASIFYFILTITFVFTTFGYIQYIERNNCFCANTIGEDMLQILVWLRIVTFIIAIISMFDILYTNSLVNANASAPNASNAVTKIEKVSNAATLLRNARKKTNA